MNSVSITGRLTKDPVSRQTTSGKTVVEFSLAVDDPYNKEHTDFFNVSCWDKQAEFVSNYVTKGRLVAITGRLRQRKWTTQEGQNRGAVEIVADRVEGLDRPKDGTVTVTAASPTPDYDPFAEE